MHRSYWTYQYADSLAIRPRLSKKDMSAERVKDKKGEIINEGDHVYTRYRGGSHEGYVRRYFFTPMSFDRC